MSTRVGIIAEGPIDREIIQPILSGIARDRNSITWPIDPEDLADFLQMRIRGHGGVQKAVERLVRVLQESSEFPYSFVVILLDRRTMKVQRKVRQYIRGDDRFVLGICKEEIEAWWLGDRTNTLAWLNFSEAPSGTKYSRNRYRAERDGQPKKTLDELTRHCDEFDRFYGDGNLDLASDFAEVWDGRVRLQEIENQCPERFPPFIGDVETAFRMVLRVSGRLL